MSVDDKESGEETDDSAEKIASLKRKRSNEQPPPAKDPRLERRRVVCNFYLKGSCIYGANCRYSHGNRKNNGEMTENSATALDGWSAALDELINTHLTPAASLSPGGYAPL
jgi:hypothetical protein